jgi:hypothetical protein
MAEFDPTQFGAVAVEEPFDPISHGAVPHEEPSILQKTGRAVVDTLKGFLPQSVEEAALAPVTALPGIGKVGTILSNIAFGKPVTEGLNPLEGIPVVQRIPQIIEAEKTPALSQERFTTGAGVVTDIAMLAGFKGAFKPEVAARPSLSEVAGIAKPETPMAAAVEPVPGVEAPPVPEVQPTATAPIETIPQEVTPNAIEPSNAQIQTPPAPLRVEAGTESGLPRTSDSDNVIREAQGTAESGEIPARQGIEAQPQTQEVASSPETVAATEPKASVALSEAAAPTTPTEEANKLYPNDPFRQYVHRGLSEKESAQLLREENSDQPDWDKIRELKSKLDTPAKIEIPEDAKATVKFKTDTGDYVSREMNAKEAEGIFTKERSSYKALIDCLGR